MEGAAATTLLHERRRASRGAADALHTALAAAARRGRTLTAGEASTAAFGAWVPTGLRRALALVSLRCQRVGEPDLTALVAHRPLPAPWGTTAEQDALAVLDPCDAERRRCWRHWATGRGPDDDADTDADADTDTDADAPAVADDAGDDATAAAGPAGRFAERGVVCGSCLTVVGATGTCRCAPR